MNNNIGVKVAGKPDTFAIKAEQLHNFRPHQPPMILLEEVTECNVHEKRLAGTKVVRATDPYVLANFPGDPFMPPSFVVETLAQACGCLMNVLYFADRGILLQNMSLEEFRQAGEQPQNALAEAKIKQSGLALVGETLTVHAKVVLQRKEIFAFHVSAGVGERSIASGEIILAYPNYLPTRFLPAQPVEASHVAG